MKVLVSGGAGYIGSVLVRLLLEKNYQVRVVDNLLYGGESIVDLLNNKNFEFFDRDIRNQNKLLDVMEGVDAIAHLAAIVGDPACAKQPVLARETNLEASKKFYGLANRKGVKKFVFASTCSNYGKMANSNMYVNEESKLAPVSLYAETKVHFEQFLLEQNRMNICKPTCLRFSTVYGLSSRPRFDLTVNEFTKEIALGRKLLVFGEQFWRPYCHVVDLARSVINVIEAKEEKVAFEVFNVGDTGENYTKQMIVNEISNQLPNAQIEFVKKDEDPRDYRVNFDKIRNKLDFQISMRVPDGINQIKKAIIEGLLKNPDDPRYKNV